MPELAVTKWDAATAGIRLRRIRVWRTVRAAAFVLILLSIALDHLRAANRTDDWFRFDGRPVAFTAAVDGRTIEVRDGDSDSPTAVRIVGIAPDRSRWNDAARRRLAALLQGRELTIHLEPTQTRDEQGSLLASVFTEDGLAVGPELIKEGLARADRHGRYSFHAAIWEAEHDARKKQVGLWSTTAQETFASSQTR